MITGYTRTLDSTTLRVKIKKGLAAIPTRNKISLVYLQTILLIITASVVLTTTRMGQQFKLRIPLEEECHGVRARILFNG